MKILLKLLIAAGAGVLTVGTAQAQDMPPGAMPAGPGLSAENSTVRNGGDTTERDAASVRDAAIIQQRQKEAAPRTARAVAASPNDIAVGREVRDTKGVVIGTIDSVSMSAAVVSSPGGKVEVPLEGFGKNNKGLLVGMTKAEFDAAVAAAMKPGS